MVLPAASYEYELTPSEGSHAAGIDLSLQVEGPRSVGKSTLLRQVAETADAEVLDLDDPATRDAVAADPALYVRRDRLLCIDEYQKAPIILDAIKAELNRRTRPGMFLLAGSVRHDTLPDAAQALTGRLTRTTLHPFTQGELAGVEEQFIAEMLTSPESVIAADVSQTDRTEYVTRITRGGLPLAYPASTDGARHRWLDQYVQLTLERDVRELRSLRQGEVLAGLTRRLAGQTAQVLNVSEAGHAVGLDFDTADSYITLLEKVFLFRRLPAWGKTLTSRSAARPKIHVVDSAVAARLLRLAPKRLAAPDPSAQTEFGHLVESFVVGELTRQASWHDRITTTGHWRTRDNLEVDLIIETDDGAVYAFEVKAGSRVSGTDSKALIKLRNALGDRFKAGYIMNLGERSYTYQDRIHIIPIDRLWTTTT